MESEGCVNGDLAARRWMRRALAATPPSVLLFLLVTTLAGAQTSVNPQAAALADFQQRLTRYLELREDLADKLKPLSTTTSAAELAARQESLAAALREVRKTAKPGDLIPPAVAELIRKAVAADLKRRTAVEKRSALAEVPDGPPPVINKTYPAQAPLATVPPLLLNDLPRLPDNLQYRFYDRHIIILDGDVEIIVDYIGNALPPH